LADAGLSEKLRTLVDVVVVVVVREDRREILDLIDQFIQSLFKEENS
jgi:hypothetical protein